MKSKEKVKGGDNRARGIAKPKALMVAEGSLQSRAPGYVMPGGLDTPFPKGNTGSMQSESTGRGQRAGVGSQAGGWSARQQAQRMQARGEQDRLGESRQSGNGASQQRQDSVGETAADAGSKRQR